MKTLIKNGTIINENSIFKGDIIIDNDIIEKIIPQGSSYDTNQNFAQIIDACDEYIIPGVIDDQVHFRDPGLTTKEDIYYGSRAAVAGGVSSFMDMPNVLPPTTSLALLKEKQKIGAQKSLINYSFYFGATNDNIDEIRNVDPRTTCGIKVFMGSSTGNMLVDNIQTLEKIFSEAPTLIATHCEDTPTINANIDLYKARYGEDIPIEYHHLIRSREACLKSSSLAVKLAKKYNSRLHVLHLSTADEIPLFSNEARNKKRITGEVCVHHLWFNNEAYLEKGNLVRWNPAIKLESDRQALLKGISKGNLDVIATDHAPHLMAEKTGKYLHAAGGGPLVQHSLVMMLELAQRGEISLEKVVDCMCHAPADVFRIEKRGYLREGYKADICIFKKSKWTVDSNNILYKCAWSPMDRVTFHNKVVKTIINGKLVFDNGCIDTESRGELLTFAI